MKKIKEYIDNTLKDKKHNDIKIEEEKLKEIVGNIPEGSYLLYLPKKEETIRSLLFQTFNYTVDSICIPFNARDVKTLDINIEKNNENKIKVKGRTNGGGAGDITFLNYNFTFKYHKNPPSTSGGKQTSKKVKRNYTQKKLKVPKKQGKTNTVKKYKVGKQSKQSK